jgi:hypothetical protein
MHDAVGKAWQNKIVAIKRIPRDLRQQTETWRGLCMHDTMTPAHNEWCDCSKGSTSV